MTAVVAVTIGILVLGNLAGMAIVTYGYKNLSAANEVLVRAVVAKHSTDLAAVERATRTKTSAVAEEQVPPGEVRARISSALENEQIPLSPLPVGLDG